MSESISDIAKIAMNYNMKVTEIAAKKIAMANVPVAQNSRATSDSVNSQLFASLINGDSGESLTMNQIVQSETIQTKQVYEPSNPYANEEGFVTYPDIDVAEEFVKMTLAKRAYEANVRIYNNASSMRSKGLEIGK